MKGQPPSAGLRGWSEISRNCHRSLSYFLYFLDLSLSAAHSSLCCSQPVNFDIFQDSILGFLFFFLYLAVMLLETYRFLTLFKRDFIYFLFFRERRREGERNRERNINVRWIDYLPLALPQVGTRTTTQACALTRNQTCNPLVTVSAQPAEPHQPRAWHLLLKPCLLLSHSVLNHRYS